MKTGNRVIVLALWALFGCGGSDAAESASAGGAEVTYDGISARQAEALAQTAGAARAVYVGDFGFDMPETVTVVVACGAGRPTRLFNDGRDRVNLSMASADSLLPPVKSGTFVLYGVCHELGHMAMYRTLADRDWLTDAGAEGWAHFAGSVVVDGVYAAKGEGLWPEPYDYRADGSARLEKQLKSASPSDVARAAGQWQALDGVIGHRQFPKLFAAWQQAQPDPSEPAKKLLPALLATFPDQREALGKWWESAAPILVQDRAKSGFARVTIEAGKLEGKPQSLAEDDGTADGKRSIAGGGHARLFRAPGEGQWYLRSVSVHGARYGPVAAPADQFDVALCDGEMRPIAVWKFPYKSFDRGQAKWVRVEIPPTLVPEKFNVCAVFRPSATSGVYVDFDSSTHGSSRVATPGGGAGNALEQGDWMIRVELDRPKGTADLLRAP